MNKYLILYNIVIFSSLFYFTSCQSRTEEATAAKTEAVANKEEEGHEEEGHEESEGMGKEVHLNEAQYKAASIVLGGFEKKNLSEVINANGYTKLPPQNQAQVSVQLPGTIKTIKVIEGQYVKAGQVLATLQSMAYNNLRLEREKLREQMRLSETNLEYLKLDYARQKELSDENVTAKKVFQKVSSDLATEEARIKALKSQVSILSQNIQMGGNSNSPTINILAPISGNITEVNVTIGSAAEEGKTLFVIVDNSKLHVDLLVYEKDLYKVKPGQTVRFILTNQGATEIKGKIFNVGKSFENETKSVAVHADIVNENQMLISGMYVNALIDIGSNMVEALPKEAVVQAEGREFIFVLEEEAEEGHNAEEGQAHEEGEEHEEAEEGKEFHFQRIEVKSSTSQLGYVQVALLQSVAVKGNIVVKGAYYIQSHLTKTEGGGGHAH